MGRYDRSVSLTDQSGDFINVGNPLPTSGSGGGGGGGTSQADKSSFTEGTTQITPIGGVRIDTLVSDVADGKTAAPRITAKRALWANIRNEAGTEVGTSSDPIRTDPTGTTPQPVTDNGGSLTVDDGGGSLTVDGTVGATQSGTWAVQITDGSLIASVRNTGSNDSLNVAITDASGNQITSFGGGTQYTEGDTDATPTGTVGMWWDDGDNSVHATSPSNPLPVDIQNTPIPVTDNGGSLTVDGTVSISGTVTVSGTVAATQSGSWTVVADAGSGTFAVDQIDTASLDYDSGAGTVNQSVMGIALPGAGGPVAGGTATNPVRTDPTGTTAQPITDNGGSLTVDGTVGATQSGAWSMRITDGTDTADVFDLTNSNALAVAIVDSSGDQITSFGGGVQYTEADTDSSPTGTVAFWWDDNDNSLHAASPSNPLPVDVIGSVAVTDGGGSLTVDGTVSVSGTVGVTQSTSPWVVGDGGGSLTVDGPLTDTELRAAPVEVDASGTPVPVTDNGGSLTVDDGGSTLTVDGTVAVAGTTATGVSLAGVNPVAIGINSGGGLNRFATAIIANRDTDGTTILGVAPVGWDAANSLYRDLEVDSLTNLKVALGDSLPAGTANIGDVDVLTLPDVQGALTHDTVEPGATNIGVLPAVANEYAPEYSEGNQVLLSTDLNGAIRVVSSSEDGPVSTRVIGSEIALAVFDPVAKRLLEQIFLAQQEQSGTSGRPDPVQVMNTLDCYAAVHNERIPSYSSSTTTLVTSGTGTGDYHISTLYLPENSRKKLKLKGLRISGSGSNGGRARFRLRRITADGGAGTTETAVNHDTGDPTADAVTRRGSTPTYVPGDLRTRVYSPTSSLPWDAWTTGDMFESEDWTAYEGQGFALEYTVDVALSAAENFAITWHWTEENLLTKG